MRPTRAPLRVVVADDHAGYRQGLVIVLQASGEVEVIGQVDSGPQAVEEARRLVPDAVLVDLRMPGGGIAACEAISHACPQVAVVVLTMSDRPADRLAAQGAGAAGYLLKDLPGPLLVDGLRTCVDRFAGRAGVGPC